MIIFIKTLENKYILQVEPENTIAHLKYQIQNNLHIQYEQQRLIFNGSPMDNEHTLLQYGVHKNSTIHLLLCMI
jgi:ubiquitin C